MMKRTVISLFAAFVAVAGHAQYDCVVESHYQPLTMEEMIMAARAEAYHQQKLKERFIKYKDKAYECYDKGDFRGFIYYSDFALETGWCNGKLYYDRGVAYETFNEYGKAKREYKRSLKKGYYLAESALEQCKVHKREWKKSR